MKKIKLLYTTILSVFMVVMLLIPNFYSYAGKPSVPSNFSVAVGGTLTIPCDLNGCEGKTKRWHGVGDSIVVGGTGTVKGISLGTGTAYCSTEKGEVAICEITVVPASVLNLNKNSITMKPNSTKRIKCSVSPENAIKNVKWESSNNNVVTVDSNGNITSGNNNGDATVYCISMDGTNSTVACKVKVYSKNNTTTKKKTTTKKNKVSNKTSKEESKQSTQSVSTSKKESSTTSLISTTEPTTISTTKKNLYVEVSSAIDNASSKLKEEENENSLFDLLNYDLIAQSKRKKPISISWKKIKGADGYELYCFENGCYNLIYDGNKNEYQKHLFINGKIYYFRIRGYKYENGKKVYFDYSNDIGIKAVGKSLFERIL